MSEFSGLWTHQNNPACAESIRVFIMKLNTIPKKKESCNERVLTVEERRGLDGDIKRVSPTCVCAMVQVVWMGI